MSMAYPCIISVKINPNKSIVKIIENMLLLWFGSGTALTLGKKILLHIYRVVMFVIGI